MQIKRIIDQKDVDTIRTVVDGLRDTPLVHRRIEVRRDVFPAFSMVAGGLLAQLSALRIVLGAEKWR